MFAVNTLNDPTTAQLEEAALALAEHPAIFPGVATPVIFTDDGQQRIPLETQNTAADIDALGKWWGEKMAAKHGKEPD